MNNTISTIASIIAILTLFTLNLDHALKDYGITTNPLCTEVLAQSIDSGGGNGTGVNDSEFKCGLKHESCKIKITSEGDLKTLQNRYSVFSFKMNVELDVSDLTQIYYQGDNISERVRCGQDRTCHDIILGTDASTVT
ncbi:hypothetical protein [Parabacteroides pacaensis]|uniref:hypothetical protein n=1 Tax=Parabacteroides pacaensis TaxID=2086575 RepID=UPI000D1022FD|nr:hypothetical protein [Parabacteroides pacaensis]